MIWSRLKEIVGDAWGAATTMSLTVGVAILAIPLPADLMAPVWLRWTLFGVAVLVAVARKIAPPPPNVPIKTDDHVEVSANGNVVTVVKANGVPSDVVSKKAGTPT